VHGIRPEAKRLETKRSVTIVLRPSNISSH